MNERLSIGTEVPKHRTADRHSQARMRDITRLDFRPWNGGVCQCVADCLQAELDVRGLTQVLVAMPTYANDVDRPKISDQLAHPPTARVRRMSSSPRLGRVSGTSEVTTLSPMLVTSAVAGSKSARIMGPSSIRTAATVNGASRPGLRCSCTLVQVSTLPRPVSVRSFRLTLPQRSHPNRCIGKNTFPQLRHSPPMRAG